MPDGALGWDSVPAVAALPRNGQGGPVVVYLGDSFTQRAAWPDETQRFLAMQGIATEGFNLGVSGYGTTQEWLKLSAHADRLRPDAIVVLFFAWNDLRDNYPYPELYYGPQRTTRPYLLLADGDTRVSPVGWISAVEARLLGSEAYLRVVNRARLSLNAAVFSRWPDLPSRLRWRARVYYEHPASWRPFYRVADAGRPYVAGAYATTVEAFRRIRALAQARRAALLVIGIDNSFTVDADDRDTFLTPHPELDPALPLARMARLLAAEGIAFINAQPDLAVLRHALGHDVYNGPPGGLAGHLGPEGDRLIGAVAARWLAEHLRR